MMEKIPRAEGERQSGKSAHTQMSRSGLLRVSYKGQGWGRRLSREKEERGLIHGFVSTRLLGPASRVLCVEKVATISLLPFPYVFRYVKIK